MATKKTEWRNVASECLRYFVNINTEKLTNRDILILLRGFVRQHVEPVPRERLEKILKLIEECYEETKK